MKIKFSVPGEPSGKGRPRFVKQTGRTYTPKETAAYENLIKLEYQAKCPRMRFADTDMLDLRIMAYYSIPASASKKKKKQMEDGEIRPTKKPDMDNIVKVVSDALNTVAYRDDAQIVDCQIRKFYSTQPRIEVTILTANR